MNRENLMMWVGFLFGGSILFLFSSLGISQFYNSVDRRLKFDEQEAGKPRGSK